MVFILSGAMLFDDLYVVLGEFLFASVIYFRFVAAGAVPAFIGAYLIRTDLIASKFGIKTWEDWLPDRLKSSAYRCGRLSR